MLKRPVTLRRTLRPPRASERDEADRRYNDALTALDRSLPRLPRLPHAAAAPTTTPRSRRSTSAGTSWPTALPPVGGLRARLAALHLALVGPLLERQQAFNAALVDHINRNVAAHREPQQAADVDRAGACASTRGAGRVPVAADRLPAAGHPYVDTKDRPSPAA